MFYNYHHNHLLTILTQSKLFIDSLAPPSVSKMTTEDIQNTLLLLGHDLIALIVEQLLHSGELDTVLALSSVCKPIHEPIVSILFRDVSWPKEGRVLEFFPSSLRPYIRHLSFVSTLWLSRQMSRHTSALKHLSDVLPDLPSLVSFVYQSRRNPPLEFLRSLSLVFPPTGSLVWLEITAAFLAQDSANILSAHYSGLRHLVLQQPDQFSLRTVPESKCAHYLHCVLSLLLASSQTLEYVKLPGEFAPFDALIASPESFPSLQTLILTGYHPLSQHPIWKLLQPSTPNLLRLEIHCRLRIIGATAHRFALMPSDALPPQGSIHLFPSQLHTLYLSNPSLKDRILFRLPVSLQSLTLDFIPDWENMLSSGDLLAYHHPEKLHAMFKMMNPRPEMEDFVLKMGWQITPEILLRICHLFPRLRTLEVQGIRYFKRTGVDVDSRMDTFLSSLPALPFLHTLKLALELKEDDHIPGSQYTRRLGSVRQSARRWSLALHAKFPALREVAFEVRPFTGKDMGPTRVLVGEAKWLWFSICHRSGEVREVERGGGWDPKKEYAMAEFIRGVRGSDYLLSAMVHNT